MSVDTKTRILDEALKSFSRNGYAGTNLKDIAAAAGLVKSGIYRHYADKEELWNAALDEMERYYAERFGSAEAPPAVPRNTEELKALALRMLNFTVYDEKIVMTRKILMTEQFRDERARLLATAHFDTGPEAIFTRVFDGMMQNGSLKKGDPAMLAFAFAAPVATLVRFCDREPDRRAETMEKIEAFIGHFIDIYGGSSGDFAIGPLTKENFNEDSLRDFDRYQAVGGYLRSHGRTADPEAQSV